MLIIENPVTEVITEVPFVDVSESNFVEEETLESISTLTKEEENTPVISEMQFHFIDVGQGDATLVTCDDEAMLMDAGDNSKGTTVRLYLKKRGITEVRLQVQKNYSGRQPRHG